MIRVASLPVLACLAAASCAPPPAPPSAPVASLGRPADFSAPDDRGDLTHVPQRAARATVLELWATSCEPCRRAVPQLAACAPGLAKDGIDVVLVAVLDGGEPIDDGRAALASWGVALPFLIDRGGGVERSLGVVGLPATLVLDRRGVVRWAAPAGAPAEAVAAAARSVAAERRR
jgi:thiol-disulfide isomerase/thioredoxin